MTVVVEHAGMTVLLSFLFPVFCLLSSVFCLLLEMMLWHALNSCANLLKNTLEKSFTK